MLLNSQSYKMMRRTDPHLYVAMFLREDFQVYLAFKWFVFDFLKILKLEPFVF